MGSEELPQQFVSDSEIVSLNQWGLKTLDEYKSAEKEVEKIEFLKKAGLTDDEIKLYQDHETGSNNQQKMEYSVQRKILATVEHKIKTYTHSLDECNMATPTISKESKSCELYPDGHPMNDIKSLEQDMFEHLNDDITQVAKRRKRLRRLERKYQRILSVMENRIHTAFPQNNQVKEGSLWDRRDVKIYKERSKIIGPKKQTLYTIKDSKIVRYESDGEGNKRTVDIVVPINTAEEKLLEGTKMSVDDIRKMERFKDYEPGLPSKILYIKNISREVTSDQLSLIFNQFVQDNGGPIDVRLLAGRMRGQAFVTFANEDICVRALEEINGTILCGRPLIVHFGKNSNRIQDDC